MVQWYNLKYTTRAEGAPDMEEAQGGGGAGAGGPATNPTKALLEAVAACVSLLCKLEAAVEAFQPAMATAYYETL